MNKKILASVFILFIISFFLRFHNLGLIPMGLNKDETAIGYNAYSILKTGRDEYGIKIPLYFKSFNDYKLPVYIYTTAISEKFFGVTPFAVRFPSAFLGITAIISLFFLVKALSNRLDLALLSSLLLTFNPWHFFFSRTAFEVNAATTFAVLGSLIFVLTVKKKGNILLLILSILLFGLSVYSYNVARILSPLLFASLVFLNRKQIKTWPRLNTGIGIAFMLLMLLPLLLTLLNNSGLRNQTNGVFLTGANTKARQIELRSYFLSLPNIYTKVFFNSPIQFVWQYLVNLIGSFSVSFFFINGAKSVNGVENFGMFYPYELITISFGVYYAIKNKVRYLRYFLLWIVLVVLLISLTVETPHPTRSYMMVIPLTVFSAFGLLNLWNLLPGIRLKKIVRPLQIGIMGLFGYGIVYYLTIYFYLFPTKQAVIWRSVEPELVEFLDKHEKEYSRIIIDPKTDLAYTSLAFYKKIDPQEYQKTSEYKKDGLLLTASKIGRYEFSEPKWDSFNNSTKTLYITTADGFTNKPVYKSLYYPVRPVVQSANGEINAFPSKDTAYVLIRTSK